VNAPIRSYRDTTARRLERELLQPTAVRTMNAEPISMRDKDAAVRTNRDAARLRVCALKSADFVILEEVRVGFGQRPDIVSNGAGRFVPCSGSRNASSAQRQQQTGAASAVFAKA